LFNGRCNCVPFALLSFLYNPTMEYVNIFDNCDLICRYYYRGLSHELVQCTKYKEPMKLGSDDLDYGLMGELFWFGACKVDNSLDILYMTGDL
jgi:hypothetical protein